MSRDGLSECPVEDRVFSQAPQSDSVFPHQHERGCTIWWFLTQGFWHLQWCNAWLCTCPNPLWHLLYHPAEAGFWRFHWQTPPRYQIRREAVQPLHFMHWNTGTDYFIRRTYSNNPVTGVTPSMGEVCFARKFSYSLLKTKRWSWENEVYSISYILYNQCGNVTFCRLLRA